MQVGINRGVETDIGRSQKRRVFIPGGGKSKMESFPPPFEVARRAGRSAEWFIDIPVGGL
jgi:hypothetical protein